MPAVGVFALGVGQLVREPFGQAPARFLHGPLGHLQAGLAVRIDPLLFRGPIGRERLQIVDEAHHRAIGSTGTSSGSCCNAAGCISARDSGVLHLAVALGIATFTVFRKYPGLKEWLPPAGPQHKYLAAGCPCLESGRNHCLAGGRAECLATISAAEVFEAIRPLWPISARHLKL